MSTGKKSILLNCLPHKPLDVQTKQKAACRQKPAATSKQFHTGQQIHLTEALAPAEGEEVAGPIDAEHTHKAAFLQFSVFLPVDRRLRAAS